MVRQSGEVEEGEVGWFSHQVGVRVCALHTYFAAMELSSDTLLLLFERLLTEVIAVLLRVAYLQGQFRRRIRRVEGG